LIPSIVAPHLADACRAALEAEMPVITNCRKHFANGDADPENIEIWRAEMNKFRAQYTEKFTALVKK